MIDWKKILEKLGFENINKDNYNIILTCLRDILRISNKEELCEILDWEIPLLNHFEKLNNREIKQLQVDLSNIEMTLEECQIIVQKKIPEKERKKLAAYYTNDEGTKLMSNLVFDYLTNIDKDKIIIADPFLGTGRTLTKTIKKIGMDKIKMIWGIEPYSLSALVAFTALLKLTKGDKSSIRIIVGDAFEELSKQKLFTKGDEELKADLILTNPPFTRWKYLSYNYRDKLLRIFKNFGYSKYITRKEISLQILSMFLCDSLLNYNGLIISVLPASTFYTIYGRGYKNLIKKKYHLLAFLGSESQASFSIDSGFKEVIIAGIKKKDNDKYTAFGELNGIDSEVFSKYLMNHDIEKMKKIKSLYLVKLKKIDEFLDNNWLSLVGNRDLKENLISIFNSGLEKGVLGYWKDILGNEKLIRGIEMYGPDFFFIGNKYWEICEISNNHIEIKNKQNSQKFEIDKKFFVKTLRKPSLYNFRIKPEVDTYMLSVPHKERENLPDDLKKYIDWGESSNTAKSAIKNYKKFWYCHVYDQICSKEPFGNIFITDKVDLLFNNRGVFSNYSEINLAASKNFYIVKNLKRKYSLVLTAWFNSTIFFSILIQFSRKISDTWTRLLINDYLELPILNIKKISEDLIDKISTTLQKIIKIELPPFWDQIRKQYRYELDMSIARALKIENEKQFIEKLYQSLEKFYKQNTP
jgi:hypothetical protein